VRAWQQRALSLEAWPTLPRRRALRIVLLDMTEPVDATLPLRRGFVRLAGRPLVQHQLDIALSAKCERVICLVRSLEPDVIALQQRAEKAGVLFNTVTAPRDLSALVTAQDEVVVIYEGLLADPDSAAELIEQGEAVFVQPIETGLAAGFERIDINHAAAGLLRIPGRLIESLVQMPPDCDVPSSLARIALQAGVPMREVPLAARSGMGWQMIASEQAAHTIERDWIAHKLGNARLVSPGRKVVRLAILGFAPSLLHAGNASKAMIAATLAILMLAAGMGWFDWRAASFVLAALAWLCLCSATMLRRLETPLAAGKVKRETGLAALDWLFDGVLVLLIHWAAPPVAGMTPLLSLALPVTLLLLVRLSGKIPAMPGAAVIADRALLCLLLALSSVAGLVEWALALVTVALAAAILATASARSG
jgi:hypothetical protein